MLGLFLNILNLSLVGSYIILLVLLVRLALRKSPKWCSYLLWGVVFLRLIVPVFPETGFSLIPAAMQIPTEVTEELLGADVQEQTVTGTDAMTEYMADEMPEMQRQDGVFGIQNIQGQGFDSVPDMQEQTIVQDTQKPINDIQKPNVTVVLAYIWLAGVIAFGSYQVWSYYRFKKQVRGAVQIEDGVYEMQGEHLSFVLGILKPAIYLSSELDEAGRKVVLCHERVHLARRDYIIKPMALAITCIHWFNPLVWLAFHLLNKDCEMSCDEKVVSILGEESKKLYSYALLDEATRGERLKHKRENTCAVLSFGEDSIKSRIKHVLHYKKAPVWLISGTVAVLVALIVGLCSNARQDDENYESGIAFACVVTEYVKEEDGWYLYFQVAEGEEDFRGREGIAKVEAPELLDLLVAVKPEDIYGIQLELNIPEKLFKESGAYTETTLYGKHIQRTDLSVLVGDSEYQSYFTVNQIYYKDNVSAFLDEREYWVTGRNIMSSQIRPRDALEAWATAFQNKDGEVLHDLSYDQEAFLEWDMITVQENGSVTVGYTSPWPTHNDYEIFYEEGKEDVVIRYWMRSSEPEVFPCEEQVKLIKQGDLYYIQHISFTSHSEINTLEEFVAAYAPYDIRENIAAQVVISRDLNPVYNWTANTGYDKGHMRYIYKYVQEGTNPEYYDAYKNPVTAAKLMLNLGEGTGDVTKVLYRAESQNPGGSIAFEGFGEGTVLNVTYTFAEDGSSVQIPMVLAEESEGLWALSIGDLTGADTQTKGVLPADASFLARDVMDEWQWYGESTVYQVSDYGIYKLSGEGMACIYPQYMPEDVTLSVRGEILYFPANSQYREYDLDWMYDSICELNTETGEYRYIYFEQEDMSLYSRDDLRVLDGFIFRSMNIGGGRNQAIALADAVPVWNGKTTAELSAAEREEYGAYTREYILQHPNEILVVGNRYWNYTEAVIDMDGDGKAESISISPASERGQYYPYDEYYLKVDDWTEERFANRLTNQIWAFSPDGKHIYIALYEDGPSADPLTTFFRYEAGGLVEAGSVDDEIGSILTDYISPAKLAL